MRLYRGMVRRGSKRFGGVELHYPLLKQRNGSKRFGGVEPHQGINCLSRGSDESNISV